MAKLFESDDFFFLFSAILFLVVNFEPKVSTLYALMCVGGWVAYVDIRSNRIFEMPPLKKSTTSWTEGILYGVIAFVAFMFLTPIILNVTGIDSAATTQSVLNSISTGFSTKPVLEASKTTSFVVWGQLIPYVETIFFSTLIPLWIATKYGYSLSKLKDQLILMSITGIAAMLFHITAKGITLADQPALVTTFIFFFLNSYLVIHFREKIQAAAMHIAGNSIAINNILKIFKFSFFGGV